MKFFEKMVWASSYSNRFHYYMSHVSREEALRRAIVDADEAVLGIRTMAEDGKLHWNEDLEMERKAEEETVEPTKKPWVKPELRKILLTDMDMKDLEVTVGLLGIESISAIRREGVWHMRVEVAGSDTTYTSDTEQTFKRAIQGIILRLADEKWGKVHQQ